MTNQNIPTLSQILLAYQNQQKALPAFNIDSFEIFQAVVDAVRHTRLPCLVQLSAGEDKYFAAENLFLLTKKARLEGLPIYLNMDHSKDPDRLFSLIKLGFDMVHLDNSQLDYNQNLKLTQQFISIAKKINPQLIIEVEFNYINLIDDSANPNSYTAPSQAEEFILTTKADLLAVSIGNLHGVSLNYPEKLDLNLLTQIHQKIPQTYLTLHGGSGISSDQISQAIRQGIVKININTDLRLAFKKSIKKYLGQIDSEKIYDYLNPLVSDISQVAQQKLLEFSQSHVE